MENRQLRNLSRILAVVGGILLSSLLGLVCLDRSFSEPLRRLSYDLPFFLRSTLDTAFAGAIRANGRFILGGVQENTERQGMLSVRVFPPIKPLRKAALGWGLLVFSPVDPDYGVRQIGRAHV